MIDKESLIELEESEQNYQKFLSEEKIKKRREKIDHYLRIRSERRYRKYLASLTEEERRKLNEPNICGGCGEPIEASFGHLFCH